MPELARALGIGADIVDRDLEVMARRGLVRRVRAAVWGLAVPVRDALDAPGLALAECRARRIAQAERARAAAAGDDSGEPEGFEHRTVAAGQWKRPRSLPACSVFDWARTLR